MNYPYFFLLLSFFEGGTVMAAELLGAKMLAPFFGSSLYVWTTTLAMTLGALTMGYFVGGHLSTRTERRPLLVGVLLLASFAVSAMPVTAHLFFNLLGSETSLWIGLLGAGMIIIFPPVFALGMVSPLMIAELSDLISAPGQVAGQAAGQVYAISTCGGIFYTFLFGFWVIPQLGLSLPAIFSGVLLAFFSCLLLARKFNPQALLAILVIGFILVCLKQTDGKRAQDVKVLSLREGLLGQVMVTEYQDKVTGVRHRQLLVNRVMQTEYAFPAPEPYSRYAHLLTDLVKNMPERRAALVLGLGGGAVSNLLLQEAKFAEVDACEFDRRIYQAGQKFFQLDERIAVSIDDARHRLRHLKKDYSLVVFDLFRGEESPEHVLTLESLTQLRQNLLPGGGVMINSHGFVQGEAGRGNRSLFRTLRKAGYYVRAFATTAHEVSSNLLIVAMPVLADLERITQHLPAGLIPVASNDIQDTYLLTDDHPVLNLLNTQASLSWRTSYLRRMSFYREHGIPLFQ